MPLMLKENAAMYVHNLLTVQLNLLAADICKQAYAMHPAPQSICTATTRKDKNDSVEKHRL